MGIEIFFYCPVYCDEKPLVQEGVHLMVSDGCEINIYENKEGLTRAQKDSVLANAHGRFRQKWLLYLNSELVDTIWEDNKFEVYCAMCDKTYSIMKEDYDKRYQQFLNGHE